MLLWHRRPSRAPPVLLITILLMLAPLGAAPAAASLAYAGTSTHGTTARGIYAFRFDASGKLHALGLVSETSSPSFLVIHPNGRFLYAAHEEADAISAFAIDSATGKLTFLNQVPSSGERPCGLAFDRGAHWLAVANCNGGVAMLPLDPDGHVRPAVATPHPDDGHTLGLAFSPDNRFLLAAEPGLDRIAIYRFDAATGFLAPNDPPSTPTNPGAQVRHLVFHPAGKALYAINGHDSTVTAFRYEPASGALETVETVSTLPPAYRGSNSGAEIAINSAGSFLYASNLGHDSIALFAIDPQKLTLTPTDHVATLGKTPRHFTIDPTGAYLLVANQNLNGIAVFHIHPTTGQLTPVNRPTNLAAPTCLVFVPLQ
jgi:6-phosphogluconolactonase